MAGDQTETDMGHFDLIPILELQQQNLMDIYDFALEQRAIMLPGQFE